MTTVAATAERLREDARSGALDDLCRALGIDLLVLFGSARRTPHSAGDVDVAYAPAAGKDLDHLEVVNALGERYGDHLDVMGLARAGTVARFEALARGDVLVERTPGIFARRQMAAMGEFYDEQWLRDLALEALAR